LHDDTNTFEIKSKYTMVNRQKSPKFHLNMKGMSNRSTIDAVAYAEYFNGRVFLSVACGGRRLYFVFSVCDVII